MPNVRIKKETVQKTVNIYYEVDCDTQITAERLGLSRRRVQEHLKMAHEFGIAGPLTGFEFPEIPDKNLPIESVIDYIQGLTNKAIKHEDALKWFSIKVKSNAPMAVAWMGDPHLGVGCNWDLLKQDIETIKATEGMVAANGGDTVDGWSDRLAFLYSMQDISKETERRLARWFLQEAGIPWLIWLLGNHDSMTGEFATFLKTINAQTVPLLDWRAQFKLVFPNKRECLIDYAHNHKGSSIWNPMHGQVRVAKSSAPADIIAGNHLHNWGTMQFELENGMVPAMIRSRGYKWIDADNYTKRGQWAHQNHGASVVTIIDPTADSRENFVTAIPNVQRAALYLKALRAEKGA
jgi:hypothetical protein